MGYDMYRQAADGGDATGPDAYYRLNISGMWRMAVPVLIDLGAVHDAPSPKFHEGQTEAEQRALIDAPSPVEAPGIPTYKLDTNDGWLVTPLECRGAVEMARRNQDDPATAAVLDLHSTDSVAIAMEFLHWIEGSAEHGFRVF